MGDINIGVLIVVGIAVFVVGNFMGAKPKPSELKIENLRLAARMANLSPKIIATPFWLIANFRILPKLELKKRSQMTTVTQYTVIDDSLKLPQSCYKVQDGKWVWVNIDDKIPDDKVPLTHKKLDGQAVDFGLQLAQITPFVVGLAFKANSVTLLWHDDKFAKRSAIIDIDDEQTLKLWQVFVCQLADKLKSLT